MQSIFEVFSETSHSSRLWSNKNDFNRFLPSFSPLQLVGFVYACYVVSVFTEEEDSCKYLLAEIR